MNDMLTCRDLEPLITPYVDGNAPAADRAAVAAHLERCAACRDRVAAEQAARRVLQARAGSLVDRAPLDLRARCAAAMRPQVTVGWSGWRIGRLSLAAALVLAIAGAVGYGLLGRASVVLAAQLTLDHLKCFSLHETDSGPAEPAQIEARFRETCGWRINVPPTSPDGRVKLIGGRRCITADGRIAHILYRHDGRRLSLFILPSTERPSDHVGGFGFEARIWTRAGATYVVVAEEPDADVEQAAAYFRGGSSSSGHIGQ